MLYYLVSKIYGCYTFCCMLFISPFLLFLLPVIWDFCFYVFIFSLLIHFVLGTPPANSLCYLFYPLLNLIKHPFLIIYWTFILEVTCLEWFLHFILYDFIHHAFVFYFCLAFSSVHWNNCVSLNVFFYLLV